MRLFWGALHPHALLAAWLASQEPVSFYELLDATNQPTYISKTTSMMPFGYPSPLGFPQAHALGSYHVSIPWAARLRSHPLAAAGIMEAAMARGRSGCADNVSILPQGHTYSGFGEALESNPAIASQFLYLLALGGRVNRHLAACPFAVVKMLQRTIITVMVNVIHLHPSDDGPSWHSNFRVFMRLESTLSALMCGSCAPKRRSSFDASLRQVPGWSFQDDFVTRVYRETKAVVVPAEH